MRAVHARACAVKCHKNGCTQMVRPSRTLLEQHYESLKTKGFFPKLMEYMSSGPVVAMVWQV
jgi:nucleoside-diphosphate kinase